LDAGIPQTVGVVPTLREVAKNQFDVPPTQIETWNSSATLGAFSQQKSLRLVVALTRVNKTHKQAGK
jgi:hypothetical protein